MIPKDKSTEYISYKLSFVKTSILTPSSHFRVEIPQKTGAVAVVVSLDVLENGSRVDAADLFFQFYLSFDYGGIMTRK